MIEWLTLNLDRICGKSSRRLPILPLAIPRQSMAWGLECRAFSFGDSDMTDQRKGNTT
jgi:demethylmenaquinone methyltransferase/2-methoxy-6-polyprenyl-1,4-benzoquinol methylase